MVVVAIAHSGMVVVVVVVVVVGQAMCPTQRR